MSVSSGFLAGKMQWQISPIILTRGLATARGGAIPITELTNAATSGITATASGVAINGQVSGAGNAQLDGIFGNFRVLAGGTLINNRVGTYPFANQAVAANAIITDPLTISVMLLCPAGGPVSFNTKQSLMTTLIGSLNTHSNLGGTYSVVTVAKIYTDCILIGMRDVSNADSNQPQFMYQLDFVQPLVSQAAATAALNSLMSKFSNGTPPSGGTTWAPGSPVTNPSQVQGLAPSQFQFQGAESI